MGGEPEIRVWCDRNFFAQARQMFGDNSVRIETISAGKLRRYANLGFFYRWFSPWHIIHTHIPNLIDMGRVLVGLIQSLVKLAVWRPDVVFCKGGYVGLPVGLVAHWYHIPLVIHDSDTVPGLTNRLLAKHATAIGTGSPVKNYPSYPKGITKYIGIPVGNQERQLSGAERRKMLRRLGLATDRPLVLAMGGGLGAVAINQALEAIADRLVAGGLQVVLLTGKGNQIKVSESAGRFFRQYQFTNQVRQYEQVADLVITRAGATTMAELATVGVATIIIPSPYLAGDHQTKNAKVYQRAGAAVMLAESAVRERPSRLAKLIDKLMSDVAERSQLADNLHQFAQPRALDDMTQMIIDAGRKKSSTA